MKIQADLPNSSSQKGKFSAAAAELVKALNVDDLPTLGRPTIPTRQYSNKKTANQKTDIQIPGFHGELLPTLQVISGPSEKRFLSPEQTANNSTRAPYERNEIVVLSRKLYPSHQSHLGNDGFLGSHILSFACRTRVESAVKKTGRRREGRFE